MREKYHELLRQERNKRGLTQVEAAEKIGISRSYYGDIETGRTLPSGRTFLKINDVLPIFLVINDVGKKSSEGGVTNVRWRKAKKFYWRCCK